MDMKGSAHNRARTTHQSLRQEASPRGSSGSTALSPSSTLGARLARSVRVALVLAVVAFKVTEWWMATPEMVGALGGGSGRRIVPPVPDPPSVRACVR